MVLTMRTTCLALLLLLPTTSLGCTAETEPADEAETTTTAFSLAPADCTIARHGASVTLTCTRIGLRKSLYEWKRLNPLTGTFETIGAFWTMYGGDVVLRDDQPGTSPVYELHTAGEWYLPKGASSVDGIARFVPTTDRGGASPPLVPSAGCTVKRTSCSSGAVAVRCSGGPGAVYNVDAPGSYAELRLGSGSGSLVRETSDSYLRITDGANRPITPPGTTLKQDGTLSIPRCFVTGPRFP